MCNGNVEINRLERNTGERREGNRGTKGIREKKKGVRVGNTKEIIKVEFQRDSSDSKPVGKMAVASFKARSVSKDVSKVVTI
jgi:hypothetical protein